MSVIFRLIYARQGDCTDAGPTAYELKRNIAAIEWYRIVFQYSVMPR